MRFDRIVMLLAIGLVLGWGLGATNEASKIGFVDPTEVLSTVAKGKAAQEELERKAREAQGRIQPMIEELEAKRAELQAKQFVMSKEALQEKQLDLVELQNRIESQGKEEENKLKIDQQRLLAPLQEKFFEVVREVGRENGYTAVMDTNAPSLIYRREAEDLTELVIKTFNKKS